MEVKLINPTQLLPYERNPRNNEETIAIVARSIDEFGFRQPIVVDEENIILAGHTRHQASLMLELEEVPVHIASGLSEAEKKSFRIMDNKSQDYSTWDRDQLAQELKDIADLDIDMTATGFTLEEIARLTDLGSDFNLPETDDIQEEFGDDITITNVRMVHLYLDSETEPVFRDMVAELQEHLLLENPTDTVFAVVKKAHEEIQNNKS